MAKNSYQYILLSPKEQELIEVVREIQKEPDSEDQRRFESFLLSRSAPPLREVGVPGDFIWPDGSPVEMVEGPGLLTSDPSEQS